MASTVDAMNALSARIANLENGVFEQSQQGPVNKLDAVNLKLEDLNSRLTTMDGNVGKYAVEVDKMLTRMEEERKKREESIKSAVEDILQQLSAEKVNIQARRKSGKLPTSKLRR